MILPSSYAVSGQLAMVGDGPIARGAIADVWEGTYHNKKVSVRCLRAPLNDDQTLKMLKVGRFSVPSIWHMFPYLDIVSLRDSDYSYITVVVPPCSSSVLSLH